MIGLGITNAEYAGLLMVSEADPTKVIRHEQLINGYGCADPTKVWITNAKHAGLLMVMANADPTKVAGYPDKAYLWSWIMLTLQRTCWLINAGYYGLMLTLQKVWITNAEHAGLFMVNADPNADPTKLRCWIVYGHGLMLNKGAGLFMVMATMLTLQR
ncbi:ACADSB [Mytilus edulis]|uniref:ACADSB n=1 Tax=Mytilus edulis TaxID=6550 RepID=A0A8S3TXW4_MYTED|nr:ACADSB [Mytilus edulis]